MFQILINKLILSYLNSTLPKIQCTNCILFTPIFIKIQNKNIIITQLNYLKWTNLNSRIIMFSIPVEELVQWIERPVSEPSGQGSFPPFSASKSLRKNVEECPTYVGWLPLRVQYRVEVVGSLKLGECYMSVCILGLAVVVLYEHGNITRNLRNSSTGWVLLLCWHAPTPVRRFPSGGWMPPTSS